MNNDCSRKGEFHLDRVYKVGENRPVGLRVFDQSIASLVIDSAEYQIIDKNCAVVAQGNCAIDNRDHTVMIYFHPETPGTHTIRFTVTISPVVRVIDLIARVRGQEGTSE